MLIKNQKSKIKNCMMLIENQKSIPVRHCGLDPQSPGRSRVKRGMTGFLFFLLLFAGCDDYERKGTVMPAITVNEHSLNMFVGEWALLTASPTELNFTWTSEDTDVATVDGNGLVMATGDGATYVIVRSGDATRRVPVTAITRIPLLDFSLSAATATTSPRSIVEVFVILNPTDANDASLPIWRSLDTDIATVDYRGVITGVKAGNTQVICTINGMEKSVSVSVN